MRRLALASVLLPTMALAPIGCVDQSLQALEPAFAIAWSAEHGYVQGDLPASSLLFGQVTTGTFRDITVSVGNPGDAALELCGIYLAVVAFDEDGDAFNEIRIEADPELTTSPLPPPGRMGPGASTNFQLRYTPLQLGSIDAGVHLVVKHELNWDCDAETGAGTYIPIVGDGYGEPVPDILAKPAQIDFGTTVIGTELPAQGVLINNVGPGDLLIGAVTLDDDTHFLLDAGTLPGATITTGQYDFLTVRYVPAFQGNHTATVLVTSNDADEDPLSIPLFGTANPEETEDPTPGDDDDDDSTPGGGIPIAVCGSTLFANPFEVVQLSSLSFHTGGIAETLSLAFSWTLTTPPGSATTLAGASTASPSTSPYVDLVGTYVGHLTVTDTAGLTDECDQTIEVLPEENFRVELFWDEEDDFDLHLLEANDGSGNMGTPWTDGDCYFSNCQTLGRDWGVPGEVYDNPYLDMDDIPGLGLENINITEPALSPYDGWYRVMVHDYTGSTEDNYGTTNGTVNIYVNLILVQTYGFSMSDDGDEYWVAKIHWPTAQVEACNGLSGCP